MLIYNDNDWTYLHSPNNNNNNANTNASWKIYQIAQFDHVFPFQRVCQCFKWYGVSKLLPFSTWNRCCDWCSHSHHMVMLHHIIIDDTHEISIDGFNINWLQHAENFVFQKSRNHNMRIHTLVLMVRLPKPSWFPSFSLLLCLKFQCLWICLYDDDAFVVWPKKDTVDNFLFAFAVLPPLLLVFFIVDDDDNDDDVYDDGKFN